MTAAVEARGIRKLFRRVAPGDHLRTLKSALVERSLIGGVPEREAIVALDDVSFSVEPGTAFGVIGGNGSGKSTLLKVLAGILQPTEGEILVDGRVAALIELGAGFHPEISGRENVYINGAVLGMSRRRIDQLYERIVEFSGLGDFMEEPVKNYSSGMYVRLGFAVAIHTDPDVLLVDEVLAVGDEAFAHRCLARMEEFLAAGKTLVLVSHSLPLIEEQCDRVLWLEGGQRRMVGEPREVIDAYRQAVAEEEGEGHRAAMERAEEEEVEDLESERRWGSGEATVERVQLLAGPEGEERYHVTSGEPVTFRILAKAASAIEDFAFGLGIATPRGIEVWGTNTDLAGFEPERFEGEATVTVFLPELRLAPGEYVVDAAIHAHDGTPYDYRKRLLRFTVTAADRGVGVYFPENRWTVTDGVTWNKR